MHDTLNDLQKANRAEMSKLMHESQGKGLSVVIQDGNGRLDTKNRPQMYPDENADFQDPQRLKKSKTSKEEGKKNAGYQKLSQAADDQRLQKTMTKKKTVKPNEMVDLDDAQFQRRKTREPMKSLGIPFKPSYT